MNHDDRRGLTPEQRALVAARLERRAAARTAEPVLREDPRDFPGIEGRAGAAERSSLASFAQERMWFLDELAPGEPTWVEHAALRLRGALDTGALEGALADLAMRHEALRTTFVHRDGQLWQVVSETGGLVLHRASVEDVPAGEREAALTTRVREGARQTFDLSVAPLVRATLVTVGRDDHLLLFVNHHAVSDGWSRGVIVRDLATLYAARLEGRRAMLPPIGLRPGDHAEAERLRFETGGFDRDLAGWREDLAPPLGVIDLPADRARPAMRAARGGVVGFRVSAPVVAALRAVGRERDATLFMVLLAAFDVLLFQHTGQTDLVVGTSVAGREAVRSEGVVGCFVNTIALRTSIADDPSFEVLLARVRRSTERALGRAAVPFDRVVAALAPARDPSRTPLFQVMLTLLPTIGQVVLPGVAVAVSQVDVGVSRLDLTIELCPEPDGGLTGRAEYDSALFDAATVASWTERFDCVLREVARAPDRPVSAIPRTSPGEDQRIRSLSVPERRVAPGSDVVSRLSAQVGATPDAVAVVGGGATLTYRQLHARVSIWARALAAHGAGPGARVGLCLEHGPDLVVALWAVLAAGAAYVPLDPTHPPGRLRRILDDAAPDLVLTTPSLRPRLPTDRPAITPAELDTLPGAEPAPVRPTDLAYVMYTSGSTGQPKGVEITRYNLASFFSAMDRTCGGKVGTWLAMTSYAFDISVLELLWPLTRGFRVVVPTAADVAAAGDLGAGRRPMDVGLFFFAASSETGSESYRLLLDAARFADDHEFSAVWTPERHFHAFGGLYPNPAVTGAALAAITRRVAIRAGSVVLPLHHPLRVAEEWAVVDNLSGGGRVGISFASGWHADDFVFAPERYAERRRHLEDGIGTIRALWAGEALSVTNGVDRTIAVRTLPRPITKDLPVWVTSSGDPATFALAGRLGAGVLTHLLGQSVDDLGAKIARYRAAWRDAGHPGTGHVALMVHTYVGDDLQQVRAEVREPFRAYLRSSLGLIRNLALALGMDLDAPGFTADDLDALLDRAFERYFGTSALLGTVESCTRMVEQLRAVGVDELACLIDFGVPTEAVLASLPKLAALRDATGVGGTFDPIGRLIEAHRVTHFQCTPSVASELVARSSAALGALETMLVGGEALPPRLADTLARRVPEVHNLYGPTEATVWSSSWRVLAGGGRVAIGRPLGNSRLYVLDAQRNPLPVGVAGDLWIGGDGVARGYRGAAELTAERFVADPFADGPEARMYRSGDRARWTTAGVLEFLGRDDRQIKVRGFRIELGDIESALLRHPNVRDAVVDVRGDAADPRIVAWVVNRSGTVPAPEDLREHLDQELPAYLIPSHFQWLERIPTNPNGKIDRAALPDPEPVRPELRTPYLAPRTASEAQIAALWATLLGVERVGVDDNFFDLGGHSLLATQLVAQLRTRLGLQLPLRTLIEQPTVAACAAWLDRPSTGRPDVRR